MAQFTFSRRLSEEERQEERRKRLDSITEHDQADYDVDMDGLNIDEEYYDVPISDFAASEYPIKVTSMKEALNREITSLDVKQCSWHILRPLMMQPPSILRKRLRFKNIRYSGSKTLETFSRRKRKDKNWFIPVKKFMKDYVQTQTYWFDFSTEPIRFPLNSNTKGLVTNNWHKSD
jgi:hypothetical protein